MKKITSIFLFMIVLPFALNGCGPSSSPSSAPVAPTPTCVPPTQTPAPPTPTLTPVLQDRTIVVISVADSGSGTLRQALLDAQSGDTITFDPGVFPSGAPATIYFASSLPVIRQGSLTIDASNAGVILDGSNIPRTFAPALAIESDANSIRGLQIIHFPDTGIGIINGASHNTIGPGNTIAYNSGRGVEVANPDSLHNTITQNSVHHNGMMGIDLWNGGNSDLGAPIITGFDLDTGTIMGSTCTDCTVEIFSDSGSQGEIYEGQTTADGLGVFTLSKGASFSGPHLTATATDGDGNTSAFSIPTTGTKGWRTLQGGNTLPKTELQHRQSKELEDNRIGGNGLVLRANIHTESDVHRVVDEDVNTGLKWKRLSLDHFDWSEVEDTGEYSRFYIDPLHDKVITDYSGSGIKMMYLLNFWDEEIQPVERGYARFKTEEEIQRYLDYVQFIVHNFKDRIEYYELTNEPNFGEGSHFTQQNIEVVDYINVAKRAIPVIRQEYPEAKIVVGATGVYDSNWRSYLLGILESDVMPLVDGVSWHLGRNASPDYDEFWYEYPSFVQGIKDMTSSHGFMGEYIVEEMHWLTAGDRWGEEPFYSDTKSAKYYARGVLMHLGMDVAAGICGPFTLKSLSTIMAGAEPSSLQMEIQSEAANIKNYNFSLPDDAYLVALWTDGVAVEDDPGIEATLIIENVSAQKVTGIDVLNGFEQQFITSIENGNLVIRSLLVRDYPLILRLANVEFLSIPQ